jgi:hypothetical protein
MKKEISFKNLLTAKQASEIVGLTEGSLTYYRHIWNRYKSIGKDAPYYVRLPYVKIGGSVRYKKEDVKKYAKDRRVDMR